MKEYGKQLDVILCADDMQALGAWDAVNEEKKRVGHDVLIMGFDSNTDSLTEVAAGNIRSTFFNDFMEQSGNASNAVLSFLKGIEVQPVMTSEYVSVTVDNAQEILDISLKWISYKDLEITKKMYEDLQKRVVSYGLLDNPPSYEEFVDYSFYKKGGDYNDTVNHRREG